MKYWENCLFNDLGNKIISGFILFNQTRVDLNTLLSEIFAGLNFAVHVLEQISREFNFAVELKFKFSILIKNNFIKWKERNRENED